MAIPATARGYQALGILRDVENAKSFDSAGLSPHVIHNGFCQALNFTRVLAAAPAVPFGKASPGADRACDLIMRTEKLSPEIAQAIADVRRLADEIDAAGSKEERRRLGDLICKKGFETIGMLVLADAVSESETAKPKHHRNRRPSLADIRKHGLEVRCEPDGAFVIACKSDVGVTSPAQTPEDELERWRKKKHAR
jgi:hypothetical protein